MKRPAYIEETIRVEKLIPGGQALGTLQDGKKIFLWNALPGEVVTKVRVSKSKSHYAEGIALELSQTSAQRIQPEDKCYLSTSPWQIMNYDYELEQKAELLQEIYRQHQITLDQILKMETDGRAFGYRNKMEYALYFDHQDEQIHLAFHARGSHQKVPISSSSLEMPAILVKAKAIVDELNAKKADARNFQSLLLRANQDGEVSGGLFENHRPHPKFRQLEDQLLGYNYSYSPNGFFQINLPVYEMALKEIKKWVKTDSVLDLFAGVGTIGLSVARDRKLTLVECDRSACDEMVNNCQNAGGDVKPVLAKSEEALEYINPNQTVIVDPPRAGCHPVLLEKLLVVTPPIIIYLSCNPATQARDVKILSEKYQIRHIQPFNFFPRTPHIENLVILERKHYGAK